MFNMQCSITVTEIKELRAMGVSADTIQLLRWRERQTNQPAGQRVNRRDEALEDAVNQAARWLEHHINQARAQIRGC